MKTGCPPMSEKLKKLLEWAKTYKMSSKEKKEQRVSFVYGQLMDAAPHITKDQIRKLDKEIYGDDE